MNKNKYSRTADEDIYLNEIRYNKPKEIHKQIVSLLELDSSNNIVSEKKLLDIGGATGEFLYYVRTVNKKIKLKCIEYKQVFVDKSSSFLQNYDIIIEQGDANNLREAGNTYDFITCCGVTSIFDDFKPTFNEMIRVSKNDAVCINVLPVNEFPIDVIIKYRNPKTGKLESGWNKFSIKSISEFLDNHTEVHNWKFIKHIMPFNIDKTDDLMRAWTVINENNERILWNGLNMEIALYFVIFNIKK